MTRISVLYPNTPGAKFDFVYYVDKHIPLAIELLSKHPGYRGVCVERGIGGAEPGSGAAYIALCHFSFNSAEDFVAAFMPHAATLQGDILNYTNIQPVIQINDVLIEDARSQ